MKFLGQVEAELNKTLKQLENQIMKDERSGEYHHFNNMLEKGMNKDEILEELQKHRSMAHHKWEEGKVQQQRNSFDVSDLWLCLPWRKGSY